MRKQYDIFILLPPVLFIKSSRVMTITLYAVLLSFTLPRCSQVRSSHRLSATSASKQCPSSALSGFPQATGLINQRQFPRWVRFCQGIPGEGETHVRSHGVHLAHFNLLVHPISFDGVVSTVSSWTQSSRLYLNKIITVSRKTQYHLSLSFLYNCNVTIDVRLEE